MWSVKRNRLKKKGFLFFSEEEMWRKKLGEKLANCIDKKLINRIWHSKVKGKFKIISFKYFNFLSGKIKTLPAKTLNYKESNIIKKKKEYLFFIQEITSKFMVISCKQLCGLYVFILRSLTLFFSVIFWSLMETKKL